MRRTVVVTALALSLLTPGSAWAQDSGTPSPSSSPIDCSQVPKENGGCPSPSPSPSPTANCPYVEFSLDKHVVAPGETVTVTARRIATEGQTVTGTLTRLSPEPAAVVRQTSDTASVTTWPLRLGESHRFEAASTYDRSQDCTPLGRPSNAFFDVNVQPTVSITAVRNEPRFYTFTGRVLPAGDQPVTLYRHHNGQRIITSQARVQPDGVYRFDRRFTGSGEFGFSVAVAASEKNLAGQSRVRPTVIH